MKIARVDVYGYDLTYVHGTYVMSAGRAIETLPSTVVRITTDDSHREADGCASHGPCVISFRGVPVTIHRNQ